MDKSNALLTELTREIRPERVNELNKLITVSKRKRKIDVTYLIWVLTLGSLASQKRTIDGLRLLYEKHMSISLARSSFYNQLKNRRLPILIQELVFEGINNLKFQFRKAEGFLSKFKELLIIDSTVLSFYLPDSKENSGKGKGKKRSFKLQFVMNALDGSPNRMKITDGKQNDVRSWRRLGKWLKGTLTFFDLGYYSFQLFDRIDQNGGYFISRAKSNINLTIDSSNINHRGRSIAVEGKKIQDILPRLKRKYIDVNVKLTFKKGRNRGRLSTKTRIFRLIAVTNQNNGKYHIYITNIQTNDLSPEQIAKSYALRWQIEILFKAMKQHMNLDKITTSNPDIAKSLIWSSILALVLGQKLYRLVKSHIDQGKEIPLLRWIARFREVAHELLAIFLGGATSLASRVFAYLERHAPDPNTKRTDRALALAFPALAA